MITSPELMNQDIMEDDTVMDNPNAKTSCADLSLGEWNPEEPDFNYLEELEHILRSPALQSMTCTYSDCDDDVYLSTRSEEHHAAAASSSRVEMNDDYDSEMPKSYLYRSTQPPRNAVHMEVQENAKIPHNYNLAVDRSGTGLAIPSLASHLMSKHKDAAANSVGVDDSFDSLCLTEAFFASAQRSSAAAAYSHAGVLLHTSEHDNKNDPHRYTRNIPLPIPGPLQLSPTTTPTMAIISSSSASLHQGSSSSHLDASSPYLHNPSGYASNLKTKKDAAPALIEASKIRSQFGFGSNHLVPSVPLPPPKTALSLLSNRVAAPNLSSATLAPVSLSAEAMSTSFYERKKQKAKDSRVKLNESIDKLSVAINVSGSQSKLRASQYELLKLQKLHGSECTSWESRKINGMRLMEDTAKTAEAARKWDRPSFVGVAASIVQDLNSQCEFLFSELLRMHTYLDNAQEKTSNCAIVDGENQFENDTCKACGTRSTPPSSTVISIDSSCMDDTGDKDGIYNRSFPKRLKTSHSPDVESLEATTIGNVLSCGDSVRSIVSFIDPKTFARCSSVCRIWRQVLQKDAGDYWLTQCIQRYGTFNVRRWEEIDETEMGSNSSQRTCQDPYYMNLYKRMHKVNVRPRCVCEGNVRLGEGKIDHIASAWVSAVVRSNGETLRSVKRIRGGTSYTSLNVIELRILLQNTGFSDSYLHIPEQLLSVDASTKRRGEEMFEITTDERLLKRVTQLDGSPFPGLSTSTNGIRTTVQGPGELCSLRLYESVIVIVYINAHQCPTTEKFRQKARFMKLLMNVNGATVPLIIPFTSPSYMSSVASTSD